MATSRQVVSVDEAVSSGASVKAEAPISKTVEDTETPATVAPEAPASEAPVKTIKFIKNINPIEKIVLKDGRVVQFPNGRTVWFVEDEKLAEALMEVAKKYDIIID